MHKLKIKVAHRALSGRNANLPTLDNPQMSKKMLVRIIEGAHPVMRV